MDIVNIYGDILHRSEIIIGVGNYNNIHGLLTHNHLLDDIEMISLPEIISPSVVQTIVNYESPISSDDDRLYFTLAVKGTSKYIGVKIQSDTNRKIAIASISNEKTYFWIDYSAVDKISRSNLLSGTLYSLKTSFGEKEYVVSWRIKGFSAGDLVMFLPTTWYESDPTIGCVKKNGIMSLIETLNQLKFKGYTTSDWCEHQKEVINCPEGKLCGECLGQCLNINHICHSNINSTNSYDRYICGPKQLQQSNVTFSSTPTTTGTTATWFAIILVVIIILLLVWGLNNNSNN